jgi:hypothetical protein
MPDIVPLLDDFENVSAVTRLMTVLVGKITKNRGAIFSWWFVQLAANLSNF